jgi:FtsH-binding integral membrane protein
MAFAAYADRRPIQGAVATLGVSQRVAFLRRTYAHLGGAVLVWAAATALFMKSDLSLRYMSWVSHGSMNFLLVWVAFMVAGYAARAMAMSRSSKVIQYAGLALEIAAYTLLTQPVLWFAYFYSKSTADFDQLVLSAALLTGVIFVGLTATVFITKKDFSFLRGALMIATFALLGVILASVIFDFQLGMIWCAIVIAILAGYILYQTSAIMRDFPPTYHVAAALMLFSTLATLFIYVLQILAESRR